MKKKCLNFICPTDCLETIIKESYQQEHYFYSSLGNSVTFSNDTLRQIEKIIRTKNIREISFVLSDDNCIVLDALNNQLFSNIRGLNVFYHQLIGQKEYLEMSWQSWNPQFLILSYFLNSKIKELKKELSNGMTGQLTIRGKIYKKKENEFDDMVIDLMTVF